MESDQSKPSEEPLPEPKPENRDVISYRRPKPGETFLGGRGVLIPMRRLPVGPEPSAKEAADDDFQFDICLVRLVADGLPCVLVVAEQSPGFGRKRLGQHIWNVVLQTTNKATLGRGTSADRLDDILQGGIDVRPTDAPIYAEIGGDKAAEYGCHEDQVIQFLDVDCLGRSYKVVPATTSAAELEEIKKTYPHLDEAAGSESHWFTRFVPDGNPARSVYESEFGYYVPGDPRRALRCVLLLSDNFERGLGLMNDAIKRAGLKREAKMDS
jgi:hypothetical protein